MGKSTNVRYLLFLYFLQLHFNPYMKYEIYGVAVIINLSAVKLNHSNVIFK